MLKGIKFKEKEIDVNDKPKNDVKACANDFYKLLGDHKNYLDKKFLNKKIEKDEKIEKFDLFDDVDDITINQRENRFISNEMDSYLKNTKIENKKDKETDEIAKNFYLKYKTFLPKDEFYDLEYEKDEESKKKLSKKAEAKAHQKEIKREERMKRTTDRILSSCKFCLANNNIWSEQIISTGQYICLILPREKRYHSLNLDYWYIMPHDHYSSSLELEENIIECVVVPIKYYNDGALYFKKALSEAESEWATHKKIIPILKEKGGIRKQIPKNFPFFHVDFSGGSGLAHVIEDNKKFNINLHHEVISTMLGSDVIDGSKSKILSRDEAEKIQKKFREFWTEFDWTKCLIN